MMLSGQYDARMLEKVKGSARLCMPQLCDLARVVKGDTACRSLSLAAAQSDRLEAIVKIDVNAAVFRKAADFATSVGDTKLHEQIAYVSAVLAFAVSLARAELMVRDTLQPTKKMSAPDQSGAA